MTDAPSLADWLLERIAEDEAAARACISEEVDRFKAYVHDCDWHIEVDGGKHVANLGRESWSGVPELADHIARHDPARVLARCAADRRIVRMLTDAQTIIGRPTQFDDVLRVLASVYADEPGFREEWR